MLDDLLLLSGNDIPLYSANVFIHQPTIREIAFIGEENFFIGCQLLNITTDQLKENIEEEINIEEVSELDMLMAVLFNKETEIYKLRVNMLLSLIFPQYNIDIKPEGFYLSLEEQTFVIDKDNFKNFQEIVAKIFSPAKTKQEQQFDYKPVDKKAQEIADKLNRARRKVAEQKGEDKISVLSRYISILAVGLRKDINDLLNYTVYQLFDEFRRFQLYQAFSIDLKARMAGATDLEEIENWMEDIHSNK